MDASRFIDGGLRPFIRFTELLYAQNVAMKELLDVVHGLDWRHEVMTHMVRHEHEHRAKFDKIYASIDNQDELCVAIQEFLGGKQAR